MSQRGSGPKPWSIHVESQLGGIKFTNHRSGHYGGLRKRVGASSRLWSASYSLEAAEKEALWLVWGQPCCRH